MKRALGSGLTSTAVAVAEPGVEGENDAPEGDGNGEGQLVEALPSSIGGVVVSGLLHLHPS